MSDLKYATIFGGSKDLSNNIKNFKSERDKV